MQSACCQITSGNDQITGCHTADRIEIMYSGYKFDGHCHDISSYLLILHLIRTICHISASSRDSEFYRDSSCCPDSLFYSFCHLAKMRSSGRTCHVRIRYSDMRFLTDIFIRISCRLHHNTAVCRFCSVPVIVSHYSSPLIHDTLKLL